MLTVIIPTNESERPLVRTLACLVGGVTAGLVRDVILADAGSADETAKVADVAGCTFMRAPGPLGQRLRRAAASARGDWLMFLRPGTVLEPAWIGETLRFIEQANMEDEPRAACFRRVARVASHGTALREAGRIIRGAFGAPRPDQGMVIAKRVYERLGGHGDQGSNPESDLIRELGRRRIAILQAGASLS
ncbi:MAG: glycosyltransferase [Pseudorhodoplanes sp.]|nr:glycosyltransferase [Pseudorhodoplanes sp.]